MDLALTHSHARVFVPDGASLETALARITHLGIGAHQDDLEFMALAGILACADSADQWFGGITCTDGAGSVRAGPYAGWSDAQLSTARLREQELAAGIGRYGLMVQLQHSSAAVKAGASALVEDLQALARHLRPRVVYTHNPTDKHDTHVAVCLAVIEALRTLPPAERPAQVLGCEGWRGLDWLDDRDKIVQNVSGRDHLVAALSGVFDTQIAGGKRYDLAVQGRRWANATFLDAHTTDKMTSAAYAVDLSPLIHDPTLNMMDWTLAMVQRFAGDVCERLGKAMQQRAKSPVK